MNDEMIHPIQIDWTVPRIGQHVILKRVSPPSAAIGLLMAYENRKWLVGITGCIQSRQIVDASWRDEEEFLVVDYFSNHDMRLARSMAAFHQLLGDDENFPPKFSRENL